MSKNNEKLGKNTKALLAKRLFDTGICAAKVNNEDEFNLFIETLKTHKTPLSKISYEAAMAMPYIHCVQKNEKYHSIVGEFSFERTGCDAIISITDLINGFTYEKKVAEEKITPDNI
ncbi:MAG: hypothetical protein K6A23_13460 [Butyrivibrio sp.]|nr:hypothetical protein [Butyrivibrio sp.]